MQVLEIIMDAWEFMIECAYCDEFFGCLKCFEGICSPWSLFVEYVNNTWVIPHKQKFAKT